MQVIRLSTAELLEARAAWDLMEDYAFVADAWQDVDRQETARQTLGSLPEEGKAWALLDGGGWQWLAVSAPLQFDTRVFGRPMARIWPLAHRKTWPEPEALAQGKYLLGQIKDDESAADVQCLVARVPGRDFLSAQALEHCGFRLMDVSVEWQTPLNQLPKHGRLPGGVSIRTWRPGDEDSLVALTAEAMCHLDSYTDRFAMDPRLRSSCGEMYRRWVANSLSGEQADQVLVLTQSEEPAGLITLKLPRENGVYPKCGWVVINAIAPELRGQGLYHELLLRGLEWLFKHGAKTARVRTKLSQQAVIRAWARLGARQVYSDCTFHLWLDQEED